MILQELLLFLVGLVFGVLCRLVFVIVSKLEKSINLRAVTVIFDILMSGAAVICFTLLLFFFADGIFLPFMFLSSCLGFVLLSIVI